MACSKHSYTIKNFHYRTDVLCYQFIFRCFSWSTFFMSYQLFTPFYVISSISVGGIGLHLNVDKTEFMCFNQRGDIFTLNIGSLKLVDSFTYLGSSISSTENDINTRLAKAWTAIDRPSVIEISDQSDKIKRSFFPSSGRVNTTK